MDKDHLLKITLALYRVTELFPAREPLKFSIREKANQILADSLLFFTKNPLKLEEKQRKSVSDPILGNIEILNSYFEVAQDQNWLRRENFIILKREYEKIREEIVRELEKREVHERVVEREESMPDFRESSSLENSQIKNERCKKILEVLNQRERAQVREFKQIFIGVSKRTLRRDLDFLLNRGLIERIGNKNNTFYRLKRRLDRT